MLPSCEPSRSMEFGAGPCTEKPHASATGESVFAARDTGSGYAESLSTHLVPAALAPRAAVEAGAAEFLNNFAGAGDET